MWIYAYLRVRARACVCVCVCDIIMCQTIILFICVVILIHILKSVRNNIYFFSKIIYIYIFFYSKTSIENNFCVNSPFYTNKSQNNLQFIFLSPHPPTRG